MKYEKQFVDWLPDKMLKNLRSKTYRSLQEERSSGLIIHNNNTNNNNSKPQQQQIQQLQQPQQPLRNPTFININC